MPVSAAVRVESPAAARSVLRALLLGLALGAIVLPLYLHTRGLAPPLLPESAWVVAAVALLCFLHRMARLRRTKTARAATRAVFGLTLLGLYGICLKHWSVAPPALREGERVQIGFGLWDWSLTEAARDAMADPALELRTAQDLMLGFGAFDESGGSPEQIWMAWTILAAGVLLLLFLFLGSVLVLSGLAGMVRRYSEPHAAQIDDGGSVAGAWVDDSTASSAYTSEHRSGAAAAKRLVVVVPGITGNVDDWIPLLSRLKKEPALDGTVWLAWAHGARWYSGSTLHKVANRLKSRIDGLWTIHQGFDEIILIGHSTGGLLVRDAYLLAAGMDPGFAPGSPWAERVARIALFASPNRGLDPESNRWVRILAWSCRVVPALQGFLISNLLRGSPFITNLRIQWIKHFDRLGERAPTIVQLIGDQDEFVDRIRDCSDIERFQAAHHVTVPNAGHGDLHVLREDEGEIGHYELIRSALLDPVPERSEHRTIRGAEAVYFILHGIRARGHSTWVEDLREMLQAAHPAAKVVTPSYGRLSAWQFAMPLTRRRNLSWFQDRYAEELASNPRAQISFIGHSNGTYLLGQSLRALSGMRFERVALIASVLPSDFKWEDLFLADRVGAVRNDRSNRDFPVAVLCSILRGLRMRDVGTGGYFGFPSCTHGSFQEVFWHDGGHSAALRKESLQAVAEFVARGERRVPPDLSKQGSNRYDLYSRGAGKFALVMALGALFLAGWWIGFESGFQIERLAWTAGATLLVVTILDLI